MRRRIVSPTTEKPSGNTDDDGSKTRVVPGIGEDGCNLPSPSGVNTKGKLAQTITVLVLLLSIGLATHVVSQGFKGLSNALDEHSHKADGVFVGGKKDRYFYVQWFLRCICSIGLPMCLGGIFLLAGYLHFVKAHDFENIVPVWGAWGIWYVPGSRAFHVAWTGVAEVVGGLGLLVGGLERMILMTTKRSSGLMASFTAAGLASDSAAWLFVLVALMTPANVFMYTHGATFPRDSGPLPLGFHAMRGTVQVVLLAILHRLGEETLEAMLMERA